MGCGCTGNGQSKVTYIYTTPEGRQVSYRSEIEAKAAQIRAGGGGNIRTQAK
ncbi:MAG TPA: hypothetical protein VFV76_05905 [Actinomycetes bacterium]|nr:hypothetical protein [Actinomycetes bacterium]